MAEKYKKSLIGSVVALLLGTSCCWISTIAVSLGGASVMALFSKYAGSFQIVFLVLAGLLLLLGLRGYVKQRKKKNLASLLLLLSLLTPLAGLTQDKSNSDDSIPGLWQTHDQRAVVAISETEEGLTGYIIRFQDPEVPCDAECLNQIYPVFPVGLKVLELLPTENDNIYVGMILDPESGETYESKVWLSDDNTLKVRDYCGVFYKTFEWVRLESVE